MGCEEFEIGLEFWCGEKPWRCTDVGSRVIVGTCLEPHEIVTRLSGEQVGESAREIRSITDDPEWLNGPPYALAESVFDEYDIKGCTVTAEIETS